jgi:transcriptional regulator with XRE-family HTH domain
MSEARTRIGRQIQIRRLQLGWTAKDVARRINRQPSRVSETETGKANSTIDAVDAMGAVMGLSLVMVPTDRLAEVMALMGVCPAPIRAATQTSVYDEVFIADQEEDEPNADR